MDPLWKQFEGLATGSGSNVFFKARLKLTGLYVLIVAVIILGFSIFLYQSISRNLKDASDDDFADIGSHQHFVQNTLGSVGEELLLADLVILFMSAGVSYVLAGKTLRPIQQSLEAQRIFAANASHELRTPLAVMRNDIEVFKRNQSRTLQSAQNTMDSNLEEIGKMSGIVEDLLLLARSDNQVGVPFENVDLAALTKTITDKMRPLAQSRDIKQINTPSNPVNIRGAANSLERMILNILQNSLDHTKAGGTVIVKVGKEGSNAILCVQDTGVGISQKDLPHVFTRFHKGESSQGTGLGLSIVKEIVNQHGGKIHIESTEEVGTTVTIHIPLQ